MKGSRMIEDRINTVEQVWGVDIGVSSVAVAVCNSVNGIVTEIVDVYVHILNPLMDPNTKKTLNTRRREKRHARRNLSRKRSRRNRLATALKRVGLFPPENVENHETRTKVLTELGQIFEKRYGQNYPYALRTLALDTVLEPYELGRALWSVAKLRGYRSNSKIKDDEDGAESNTGETKKTPVLSAIRSIHEAMNVAGARTLGEYLNSVPNPRNRNFNRSDIQDEFDAIMDVQQGPHGISDSDRRDIRSIIFFQNPLKSSSSLVGPCPFEGKMTYPNGSPVWKPSRCAPKHLLFVQDFLTLQRVRDLRVFQNTVRELTPYESQIVFQELKTRSSMTTNEIRKKLWGSKSSHRFTSERTLGETSVVGNKTYGSFHKVLGTFWENADDKTRDSIVDFIYTGENKEVMVATAMKRYGIKEDMARKLCDIKLETGYAAYSSKAIRKIYAEMLRGRRFQDIVASMERRREKSNLKRLRPVSEIFPELRNPLVIGRLSAFRKLANLLLDRYGKPYRIVVETVSDPIRNKAQREAVERKQKAQEKERTEARTELNNRGYRANNREIERYLLWKECGGVCAYTGGTITLDAAMGNDYNIDHIVPRDFGGNNFENKILCPTDLNRRKSNAFPGDFFANDLASIQRRIQSWTTTAHSEKSKKKERVSVKKSEWDCGFAPQSLPITAELSNRFRSMVMELYASNQKSTMPEWGNGRVTAVNGKSTSDFRDRLGISTLLHPVPEEVSELFREFAGRRLSTEENERYRAAKEVNRKFWAKNRGDHRHHGVDAIAIAIMTPEFQRYCMRDAERALVYEPYPGFLQDAERAVSKIVPSRDHRNKTTRGLHEDTEYGSCDVIGKTGDQKYTSRVLTKKASPEIVRDPQIQRYFTEYIKNRDEIVERNKNTSVKEEVPEPHYRTRNGSVREMRRVTRIAPYSNAVAVIGKNQKKFVSRDVHHAEVFKKTKGNGGWFMRKVTYLEVSRRRAYKQDVYDKRVPEGKEGEYLFSIQRNDFFSLDDGKLYVVKGFNSTKIVYTEATSALDSEKKENGLDALRKAGFRRKTVRLNEVTDCNY